MTKSVTAIQKNRPKYKSQKQISIAERRAEVFDLRSQGKTIRDIAKELGRSEGTIRGDLKVISVENAALVVEAQSNELVGEIIRHYEALIRRAWDDYYACDEGTPTRAKFLSLIRAIRNDQYDVFKDVGIIKSIEKDGEKSEVRATQFSPEMLKKLPIEIKNLLVQTVIQNTTPRKLREPTLNPALEISALEEENEGPILLVSEDDRNKRDIGITVDVEVERNDVMVFGNSGDAGEAGDVDSEICSVDDGGEEEEADWDDEDEDEWDEEDDDEEDEW